MSNEEIKNSLKIVGKILRSVDEKNFKKENLEKIFLPEAEKMGDKGKLLWPLRAALSGKKASPSPFEIMEILGKEETLKRLENAINLTP